MAIRPFGFERGLRLYQDNSQTHIDILSGTAAPDGTSNGQDIAPIGSLYVREGTADLWKKIADADAAADWKRMASEDMDDMFLTSAYDNATNGSPAISDSGELAIGYLDANQIDLTTLSGVAQGAVDLGTFTGTTLPDNQTIKDTLQSMETAFEALSQGEPISSLGITSLTRVAPLLVDDFDSGEWEVLIISVDNPERKEKIKISALHDGTPSADATTVDYDKFSKLKVGAAFNVTIDVSLSGAAGAQDMALDVTSSETSGVDVYVRRTTLP